MKHSPTDRGSQGIPEIQDFENTVRDNSEEVNGIRDLIATRKAGFAKYGQGIQDWEGKRLTEAWDAGFS